MNPLNIAEWSPDQVSEWMLGLGPMVSQYSPEFIKKGVNGAKLLTLRCDDLEYLGIQVIGHQELLLEAVEHLRNFHYEISRECVQQLALRVSAAAASLARALRHHADTRLETHSLADVARTVHAVKPLVCWLDRWPLCSGAPLAERKAALLKLSLEAATCAQRDRFAEQPARAVAAAAAAAAAVADYIIQDVSDPLILQPSWVDTVTLRQAGKPLGFHVLPSFCGHHQIDHIRFGSPAHASGHVHEGDEIVQVGDVCVLGWSGEAVERACAAVAGRASGELVLRLRRRGARALPTPPLHTRAPRPRAHRLRLPPLSDHRMLHRYELDFPIVANPPVLRRSPVEEKEEPPPHSPACSPECSSDESEALSPPASPTHLHLDRARMYPPKPQTVVQRRHTISCGSPVSKRPHLSIEQFWQELQQQRWDNGEGPEPEDALYRRDKAVSCSTGLQLSPRPRTCLGVPRASRTAIAPVCPETPPAPRGKLDKSHSTPAYELEPPAALVPLADNPIPESPTTPPVPGADKTDPLPKLEVDDEDKSLDNSEDKYASSEDMKSSDDTPVPVLESLNSVLIEERESKEEEHREASERVTKYPKPRVTERSKVSDVPPEPPPRPSTRLPPPPREYLPPHPLPRDPPMPSRERREIPPHERAPLARNESLEEKFNKEEFRREKSNREPIGSLSDLKILSPCREIQHVFERDGRSPSDETWEPISMGQPVSPLRECTAPQYPVLRMIPRPAEPSASPLKPLRPGDTAQISVPLRHLTKHDIKLVSNERREMPPINGEPQRRDGDIVIGAASDQSLDSPHSPKGAVSPTGSVVRGIFPSAKSRSLKKKNSILAKRRAVPARALSSVGAAGWVSQRVRAAQQQPRWAHRYLLLAHNLLYAYRSPESTRADCMIYLEGCTVSAAGEVKSRAHAFKVYHTGRAFYFAAASADALAAWTQLIHRATLAPPRRLDSQVEIKQFSETDYSETESDTESPEKRERDRDKEKDKSKFGSLKKLAQRGRGDSHENVHQAAASTSLDRKYLRFFSRTKGKDDSKGKTKQQPAPVPTEQYRSYRRAPPQPPPHSPRSPPRPKPSPINYIHASNPNLLDFERSEPFSPRPALAVKPRPQDKLVGLVTLEEFMLRAQAEERRQLYSERVLLGVADRDLQTRLDRVVPDVVYGRVPRHGYEKIEFPDERPDDRQDSFRKKDKVQGSASSSPQAQPAAESGGAGGGGGGSGGSGGGGGGAGVSRLRLMFGGRQPETYCLARLAPKQP
ncbi:uncharacterized protein LOC125060256 isoform X2 [Pieris napi]|uniref:uncharacterized protein LOC125060256 isoform X2 n=1 Tax=Pieris napi TaxID=78633 RepID=UPI001FBAE8F1|nr:uncharacterized protein LOC125060256 isoform X2 [Pieris napi]